jgi:hypothetical protein
MRSGYEERNRFAMTHYRTLERQTAGLRDDMMGMTLKGHDAASTLATIKAIRERLDMIEADCIAIGPAKIGPLVPDSSHGD